MSAIFCCFSFLEMPSTVRYSSAALAASTWVTVSSEKSEVLQGTLDLMILKTLHALGSLHGFGIARRIEQLSEEVLTLNEGTVYTSLLRLQQQGWIVSEWGTSENNRKAKFYSITKRGLKQLAKETENWERISGVIRKFITAKTSRLRSRAQRAVMRVPLYSAASTTRTPKEIPLVIRLRMGKFCGAAKVPMGNSEISAPPAERIWSARREFSFA